MREVTFNYASGGLVNVVSATQSFTASNQTVLLNGSFSNVAALNGRAPFIAQAVVSPGIQRTLTITSTGNISTSTFTIAGFNIQGTAVSTTLTGPNNGTATTTAEFAAVTSVTVGTTASSTFTVGFGASGSTNWVQTDRFKNPFAVTISVVPGATTQPVTIQNTEDDVNTVASPVAFNHSTLATVTVNTQSNYAFPVKYVRAIFTATQSTASGAAVVTFEQAG